MTPFVSVLLRNRLAALGAALLVAILAVAVAAPLLPLADPDLPNMADRFQGPLSPRHLLGTDALGRDLLSRLIWGTRLSLAVGAAAAGFACLIGASIGINAGYFGGRTDNLLMRGIDMLLAFPTVLLALAIVAVLGPGLINALIAVAIINIPFFARNVRSTSLAIAHREFIDAARLSGEGHGRVILTELLPNVLPVIVITLSTTIGWMILETAGLSFLGLGSQPPQADLGSMLGEARAVMITSAYISIVPGVMIFLIVMAVNLLGDGVRDALDPRLRSGVLTRPAAATRVTRGSVPMASAGGLLQIDALEAQFHVGKRIYRAVNKVTLALAPGECVGLVGESGSGKSVTALSVMRLVASPPGVMTGGAVRLNGEDMIGAPYARLRELRGNRVAYVFQDPLTSLNPLARIGAQLVEAIRTHQAISAAAARTRALHLLADVRIPNPEARFQAYPHELSGGMRQRVGIAMALANDPDILIADEPTTALDVTVQAQILALLNDLRQQRGLAILFVTHDFGLVRQLCDRVAVLYGGQIVEQGAAADVLGNPAHPYTRRLMACVPELGRGQRRLPAIAGLPPAMDRLPPGCAFAPRCDRSSAVCQAAPIAMTGTSRQVRCLHPEYADMT